MLRRKKKEPERAPVWPSGAWLQPVEPEPEPTSFDHDWQGEVVLFSDDGQIAYKVNSVAEAKQAIKTLRLRKKQVGLEKREVTQVITAINAERRAQTANQGRMVRGGGDFGKLARSLQGMSRDADKRNHAARLQPYQQEKARLDQYMLTIDRLITELETYILQHSD